MERKMCPMKNVLSQETMNVAELIITDLDSNFDKDIEELPIEIEDGAIRFLDKMESGCGFVDTLVIKLTLAIKSTTIPKDTMNKIKVKLETELGLRPYVPVNGKNMKCDIVYHTSRHSEISEMIKKVHKLINDFDEVKNSDVNVVSLTYDAKVTNYMGLMFGECNREVYRDVMPIMGIIADSDRISGYNKSKVIIANPDIDMMEDSNEYTSVNDTECPILLSISRNGENDRYVYRKTMDYFEIKFSGRLDITSFYINPYTSELTYISISIGKKDINTPSIICNKSFIDIGELVVSYDIGTVEENGLLKFISKVTKPNRFNNGYKGFSSFISFLIGSTFRCKQQEKLGLLRKIKKTDI